MNKNSQTLVNQRIHDVIVKANELYGFDIPSLAVEVNFSKTGQARGMATRRGGEYSLTFSEEAIAIDLDGMLNECIPHEVAHLVNFHNPATGKNHNPGWKSTCRALGGTGERCHTIPLTQKVYRSKYLYKTSCGEEVELSSQRHTSISNGKNITLRSSGSKITPEHFVRKVSPAEQREAQQLILEEAMSKSTAPTKTTEQSTAKVKPTKPIEKATAKAKPADSDKKSTTSAAPSKSTGLATATATAATADKPTRVTKADKVRAIITAAKDQAPGQIISQIMSEVGMSKPGASTYYYKYK